MASQTNPVEEEEERIKFSIQGQYFLLPKSSILAIDWMPRTMITSGLTTNMIDDVHYIDCDASSFRLLYQLGKGDIDMEDLYPLTNMEIMIIEHTARYLCMVDILPALEELYHSAPNAVPRDIQEKAALGNKLVSALNRGNVHLAKCSGKRGVLRRYMNSHGKTIRPLEVTPCSNRMVVITVPNCQMDIKCFVCNQNCQSKIIRKKNVLCRYLDG